MNLAHSTKPDHYAYLDAMRGFAAISVMLFHLNHWLNQPWLATNAGISVDFFFCLSGYVLSIAYHHRLNKHMSISQFIIVRLIRLTPITVIATLLSAAYFLAHSQIQSGPTYFSTIILAILLGFVNLPFLMAPLYIGGPQIFPLNGPQYTLFFELLVNVIWVNALRFQTTFMLFGLIIISSTILLCFGPGGDTTDNFWLGFARVISGFYLGVLLYHMKIKTRYIPSHFSGLIFLITSSLTLIFIYTPSELPEVVGTIWALTIAPLLIVAGSRVSVYGIFRKVGILLGQLSYPIYVIHYPIFVWINGVYQQLLGRRDAIVIIPAVSMTVLIASWVILRFFDAPIRQALMLRYRSRTV
ncbi:acyltransferase family protein [Methylobacterium mesophilicum]